jgi:hypothetical protein
MAKEDGNNNLKETKKIQIFISHKHENKNAASYLKKKLELYGSGKLNVFISEAIAPGKDWKVEIKEKLAQSDVFFLIFTDPSATWDWCLYEAGLYTDIKTNSENRIICIHSVSSEPTDPLHHLQAVKGEKEEFKKFLKYFFGETELPKQITGVESPINNALAKDNELVEKIAREFCDLIKGGSKKEDYHVERLLLQIETEKIENDTIPEDAIVVESDMSTLRMFKLTPNPRTGKYWTWADLVEQAQRPEDKEWIAELGRFICTANRNIRPAPIFANFKSFRTEKLHRPVVTYCRDESDGSKVFEILFIEAEKGEEKTENGKGVLKAQKNKKGKKEQAKIKK